jgi:hypothetical protein
MASLAHAGLNTENVMVCFKENHLGELLLRQCTAHPHLKRTQDNAAHRGTPMCAPKSRPPHEPGFHGRKE